MAVSHFVEAMSKMAAVEREEADRIPGTRKIRTYCADASLYSSESDLENITRPDRRGSREFAKKR